MLPRVTQIFPQEGRLAIAPGNKTPHPKCANVEHGQMPPTAPAVVAKRLTCDWQTGYNDYFGFACFAQQIHFSRFSTNTA